MIKKEFKNNLKNFIIWTSILIGLFLIVYIMYPSIINTGSIEQIDEMMKLFPEEILIAFNMDISSMDSAFGWIKTEGWVFVLLLTSLYSALLGSSILSKEENDKTIEYLGVLPIKRSTIVINKIIVSLIYILLMNVIFMIFNLIALSLSGPFDIKLFLLMSVTPIMTSTLTYSICLFISTFNKKMTGISLGIVFLSYFLNILSSLSESTEILKYASIFTLADIRNVIKTISINEIMIIISIALSILMFALTIIKYEKKEFLI